MKTRDCKKAVRTTQVRSFVSLLFKLVNGFKTKVRRLSNDKRYNDALRDKKEERKNVDMEKENALN